VGIFYSGRIMEEEVIVDDKGRILIPKAAREKLGLQVGGKARLKIENEKIIIRAPVSPEDFIKELEGCIKEGTPAVDPLSVKKMWEPKTGQAKN
jgi:AbrB family looped-hinge helix DNA binding protein